ncbi:hypothetical protein ACKFKH_05950 [Phormidesmis sp. 146-20]
MKYRIEISSLAEAEADSAFLRLSQVTDPRRASHNASEMPDRAARGSLRSGDRLD